MNATVDHGRYADLVAFVRDVLVGVEDAHAVALDWDFEPTMIGRAVLDSLGVTSASDAVPLLRDMLAGVDHD